jgi:hypothetical protein
MVKIFDAVDVDTEKTVPPLEAADQFIAHPRSERCLAADENGCHAGAVECFVEEPLESFFTSTFLGFKHGRIEKSSVFAVFLCNPRIANDVGAES